MQVLFMLVRSSPSRATDSQVASAGRIWCGREQQCWLAQSATAPTQSIEGPPAFRPPAVGASSPSVAAISGRLYLAWLLNAAAADRSLPLRRAAHPPAALHVSGHRCSCLARCDRSGDDQTGLEFPTCSYTQIIHGNRFCGALPDSTPRQPGWKILFASAPMPSCYIARSRPDSCRSQQLL